MKKKKLLIIGAGEAGQMVANEFRRNGNLNKKYNLIGFLDDNIKKNKILNFKILGKLKNSKIIIEKNEIDEVLIAIPSAKNDLISKIINYINGCDVKIKIIPGLSEIINGDVKIRQIRDFEPADFLGREEISFDIEKISDYYKDKVVFVTGGGGSIGSEIVNQLLKLPVKNVIIYGHGENSIHDLIYKINGDDKFIYVIGDVTDFNKLKYEINKYKPDIIFHAAAHKHVPLMEKYPDEALRNNVIGTFNTAKIAIEKKVKRFIMISTDKAVNPTSVMGATKRLCEKIILSLSAINKDVKFSITRFGNVLGSRGSVIPIFKTQIDKGGPITITDKDATRFFMSIREAARLVIKSGTIEEGRIFVLDMGKPVKIIDLAKNMIKMYAPHLIDIPIVFTGLRKGEKLNEELINDFENVKKTKFEKLFISEENNFFMNYYQLNKMIKKTKKSILSFNTDKIKELLKFYVNEYKGI